MATTPSGQIVVLASCWTLVRGDAQPHTEFAIRDEAGITIAALPLGASGGLAAGASVGRSCAG